MPLLPSVSAKLLMQQIGNSFPMAPDSHCDSKAFHFSPKPFFFNRLPIKKYKDTDQTPSSRAIVKRNIKLLNWFLSANQR